MKRILIVDQQQNVLDHFPKVLRPLKDELDVRFVSTSNEALLSLEQSLTMWSFPTRPWQSTDGTPLLSRIITSHPDVLRVAIINAGDHGMLVRSAGEAHQYLRRGPARMRYWPSSGIPALFVICWLINRCASWSPAYTAC